MRTLRIGILGSTRGTDMSAVLEGILQRNLNASVVIAASDRKRAGILERARGYGIPAEWVNSRDHEGRRLDREEYDRKIDALLRSHQADLVVLIGYMRIVSPWFCSRWEKKLVNVHPSLLPDFAGGMDSDVHTSVIESGRTHTGCTVHLVTAQVDKGPILLQKRCRVLPEDTPEMLKQRVQKLEGEALLEVIEGYINRVYDTHYKGR
jgi:formyltetrahydrofolate-dependent phosphoribosylglycinamide formyltransferase